MGDGAVRGALIAALLATGIGSAAAEEGACLPPGEVNACELQRQRIAGMTRQIKSIEEQVPSLEQEAERTCESSEDAVCAELAGQIRDLVSRYHSLFDEYEDEVAAYNQRCADRMACKADE